MRVCRSPELIAAYHGLHRLRVPRHPPHAFARLTTNTHSCVKQSTRDLSYLRVTINKTTDRLSMQIQSPRSTTLPLSNSVDAGRSGGPLRSRRQYKKLNSGIGCARRATYE